MFVGVFFGIIMTKSEAISWFRIYEMFRFESFHMYGIIGTAVVLGAAIVAIMKKTKMKTLDGELVDLKRKIPLNWKRHIIAGSIFGLGWAVIGCCPGPIYVLLGNGYSIAILFLVAALAGTFTYGLLRNKLPH
jgi:uncharacterized membrane protein YedE/YeeE